MEYRKRDPLNLDELDEDKDDLDLAFEEPDDLATDDDGGCEPDY